LQGTRIGRNIGFAMVEKAEVMSETIKVFWQPH
jgi:hypothetical protein